MNPDDFFDADSEPLEVETICSRCSTTAEREVPWACVHPDIAACEADGWDGVVLGAIVECEACGACDDYALAQETMDALVAWSRRDAAHPRVWKGVVGTMDGSVMRRPSEAIAELRAQTCARPDDAETWRRLGNSCSRFGLGQDAEIAWLEALKHGPTEFEAAHSLMLRCLATDRTSLAFGFLRVAIERLAGARLTFEQRAGFAESLARHLFDVVEATDDPIALDVAHRERAKHARKDVVVLMSSVDLRRVRNWDGLTALLASDDLVAARVSDEVPTEQTALGAALETELVEYTPSQPVVREAPRVGRNDPCPCGSGKKSKRCCDGRPHVRAAS
jgi:hypothetical protein